LSIFVSAFWVTLSAFAGFTTGSDPSIPAAISWTSRLLNFGPSAAAIQLQTCQLATGRFITIMPESVIHFGGKHLAFTVLPVDLPLQLSPVFIITLKNRTPNPAAQLVIDCAHEVARPLAKQK